jgi:hypothetical protein
MPGGGSKEAPRQKGEDMAKKDADKSKPTQKLVAQAAFPGDQAPPELSVAIVSLVELCQLAMPDPAALRKHIAEAGFVAGPPKNAATVGATLALDNKVFDVGVRNLRHEIYGRDRNEALVTFLLTEGDSAKGKVVFCSTLFHGAIEGDAVKAAAHVTKKQPLTGATLSVPGRPTLRRVFWDTEGAAGMRGLMVTGPDSMIDGAAMRAFTAFNFAAKK